MQSQLRRRPLKAASKLGLYYFLWRLKSPLAVKGLSFKISLNGNVSFRSIMVCNSYLLKLFFFTFSWKRYLCKKETLHQTGESSCGCLTSIFYYSQLSIYRISQILRSSKRLSESKIHFDCFLQPKLICTSGNLNL